MSGGSRQGRRSYACFPCVSALFPLRPGDMANDDRARRDLQRCRCRFVCLFVGWLVVCLCVCLFVCLFVVGRCCCWWFFLGFFRPGAKIGGGLPKKGPPPQKKNVCLGGETNAIFFFLPSRLRALFSAFFAFSPVCVLKRP